MAVMKRGKVWRVMVDMGKNPRTGKRARMCWTFDAESEARESLAVRHGDITPPKS